MNHAGGCHGRNFGELQTSFLQWRTFRTQFAIDTLGRDAIQRLRLGRAMAGKGNDSGTQGDADNQHPDRNNQGSRSTHAISFHRWARPVIKTRLATLGCPNILPRPLN